MALHPLKRSLPLVGRIADKVQLTIEEPTANESEAERFLAYIEPFSHVIKYPSFFLEGTGAAQRKWSGNLYEEADTASHASTSYGLLRIWSWRSTLPNWDDALFTSFDFVSLAASDTKSD